MPAQKIPSVEPTRPPSSKAVPGLIILTLGIIFVLKNYGLLEIDFDKFWPLILVATGFWLVMRK